MKRFIPIRMAIQVFSSLLKDVPAIVTLISAVLPPSVVTLAPRYLKLSTSSAAQFPTVRLASRGEVPANSHSLLLDRLLQYTVYYDEEPGTRYAAALFDSGHQGQKGLLSSVTDHWKSSYSAF